MHFMRDRKSLSEDISPYAKSRANLATKIIRERSSQFGGIKKTDRRSLEKFKKEIDIDDHIISIEQLEYKYDTDVKTGLRNEIAELLYVTNGPNSLRPPKIKSKWAMLVEYIFCGLAILLWIGAILSYAGYIGAKIQDPQASLDQIYLGTTLVFVILVTGLYGFYQEAKNSDIMQGFQKMVPKSVNVIRGGVNKSILSERLVLGDLVEVNAGDCVPADIRIVDSNQLKVDNSSITGESDPLLRTPQCTDENPLETSNLIFFGTNVVEGNATGIVVACGDDTLMGHIAGLTQGVVAEDTPIKKELKRFLKIITTLSLGVGLIFFVIAMSIGQTFFRAFLYLIAIIIAGVPCGILITMTASLTLTARKMAKKMCLCKNFHAIETLGSVTVICSDKTGTLTQNRMTVSHMFYNNIVVDILSDEYSKSSSVVFKNLCRVGTLCLRAEFEKGQENIEIMKRKVKGDASETAVLKCMETVVGKTDVYREQHKKLYEVPFNSSNKYQLSIHKVPDSNRLVMVMKGAPERIIARCITICLNEETVKLDETIEKKLSTALLEIGFMGERVLGFCDLELPEKYNEDYAFSFEEQNFPLEGLRFCGFMSMIDPPRPGVPEAVAKCKTAGIRVIMVTGDHPVTAMAISKKVGIISSENETVYDIAMRRNVSVSHITENEARRCTAAVITGTDLREMTALELEFNILHYNEIVFARTSPQQKLQIVEAFQDVGNIVAVTGDGVNDSPALKKGDVGVAMGITGSDVSKEAADMIILDDNFASIVTGIEEGRLIFDNLKKAISYMLTSNIPEVVPFLLHVLAAVPLPLTVIAILVIDMGTDLWPGISLAYEKAEADIMTRPPRNPKTDRLVSMKLIYFANLNIGVAQACAGLSCYFFMMADHGFMPKDLIGIRDRWYSKIDDLKDSYGQEWTHYERDILEKKGVSAFFLGVVMTQVADVVIAKTRRLSVVQQGMNNRVMNMGIIFECCLAAFCVYCPYINSDVFGLLPVGFYTLMPAIPFCIIIFAFDEIRKYCLRKYPGGWVERETYF